MNTKPVRMWKEKSFPPSAGILTTKAVKKKNPSFINNTYSYNHRWHNSMGSMAIYLSETISFFFFFFFFDSKLFINHRKRKMEPWCLAAGVQTQTR